MSDYKFDSSETATNQKKLRFAELFAGIGLVRKGLEQSGWECVFANDIDEVKGEIYAKNFGNDHLRIDDVAKLHSCDIPNVTLITASFPCQDLSLAGNRKGLTGKRSSTFFEFRRILTELASVGRLPQVVAIENVIGLLTSSGGNDIREVLLSLNQLGYSCDVLVIDAINFLPQSRPRVFIVGIKTNVSEKVTETLAGSSSVYLQHPCRPTTVQKVIFANPELSWNFLELPPLPKRATILPSLLDISDHQEWFGASELARELSYIRHKSKERLETAKQLAHSTGRTVYLTAYRRMRKGLVCLETRDDGIAGCLRTTSGGSSRQVLIAVLADRVQMRYMTAREYGRLQGVEDSFWIPDNHNVGRYAFGDAVAVPVVVWLGWAIKHNLVFHSQRPVLLNKIAKIAVVNV